VSKFKMFLPDWIGRGKSKYNKLHIDLLEFTA